MALHCRLELSAKLPQADFHFSISPTVYVAYDSLSANAYVRAGAQCNISGLPLVGQSYNTTIAYAPEALSTSQGLEFAASVPYTAINYTLLQYPTPRSYHYGSYLYTYTPQIYLSLPADLSLVDPAWKNCLPNGFPALDPPRALGSALALVSIDSSAQASPVAIPGASVAPAHAPATATPEPTDPGSDAPQIAQPTLGFPESHLGSNGNQTPISIVSDAPDPNVATPTLQAPDPRESAISSTNLVVDSAAPTSSFAQDMSGDKARGAPSNPVAMIMGSSGGEYPEGPRGNNPSARHSSGLDSNSDLPPADPVQVLPSAEDRPSAGNLPSAGDRPSAGNLPSAGDLQSAGNLPSAGDLPPAGNLPSAGDNQAQMEEAGSLLIGSNRGDNVASLPIPAGSKSTIAGHVISAFTSSGAILSSIYALPLSVGAGLQPSVSPSGPLLIAGEAVVRASGGGMMIGSSTIEPGSLVTISGYSVSAGHSDVLTEGSIYTLPSSVGAAIQQYSNLPTITFASSGIISAGGAPIALSGNVYSILSGGSSNLVANGSAVALSKTAQAVFQMDGQVYTAVPTGFSISGQTIAVGRAAVTIDGTVLSLGPSGVQIGSSTIPLNAVPTGLAISGQTIAVGGSAVTIGGTVLSMGPSGLLSGSSMIPLNAEQTDQANLGSPIMSGSVGAPTATSGATKDLSVINVTRGSPKSANKSLVDVRIAVLYLVGMAIGIAAYAL